MESVLKRLLVNNTSPIDRVAICRRSRLDRALISALWVRLDFTACEIEIRAHPLAGLELFPCKFLIAFLAVVGFRVIYSSAHIESCGRAVKDLGWSAILISTCLFPYTFLLGWHIFAGQNPERSILALLVPSSRGNVFFNGISSVLNTSSIHFHILSNNLKYISKTSLCFLSVYLSWKGLSWH